VMRAMGSSFGGSFGGSLRSKWRHQWGNEHIFMNVNGYSWIFTDFSIRIYIYISGWWFGSFLTFHNIWDNPSHWLIFFKMVKTTNQIWMTMNGYEWIFTNG
jgi:hypothetical protein